jgi:hypothetical protein
MLACNSVAHPGCYPGSYFFLSRIQGQKDRGSRIRIRIKKNLSNESWWLFLYLVFLNAGLWIRILIRNPDPDPGGQK